MQSPTLLQQAGGLAYYHASCGDVIHLMSVLQATPSAITWKQMGSGYNILHEAVQNNHPNIILRMTTFDKNFRPDLWMAKTVKGETPLELAIKCQKPPDLILAFLPAMEAMYDRDPDNDSQGRKRTYNELTEIVAKAASSPAYAKLRERVKYLWVKSFAVGLDQTTTDPRACPSSWFWTPGAWTNDEYTVLYKHFISFCSEGKRVETLNLQKWAKLSLVPRMANTMTPPDAVASGIAMKSVGYFCSPELLSTLCQRWNGNIDSFHHVLGTLYAENNVEWASFMNKYTRNISGDSMHILNTFSMFIATDLSFVVPTRLDKVIEVDRHKIVKWMAEKGFIRYDYTYAPSRLSDFKEDENFYAGDIDPCAICLSEKEYPFPLHDNHSFCQACVLDYVKSKALRSGEILCPLCNRKCPPPRYLQVCEKIVAAFKSHVYWLNIHSGWTLYKILLGYAAGNDSVGTFAWLASLPNSKISELRYNNGATILHVVASRGSPLVCKWLLTNGYANLLTVKDFEGNIPFVNTSTIQLYNHIVAEQMLSMYKTHPIPKDVLEHVEKSWNPSVVKLVKNYCANVIKLDLQMRNLLKGNASKEQLVTAWCNAEAYCNTFANSTEEKSNVMVKLISSLVKHRRKDAIIHMLYSHLKEFGGSEFIKHPKFAHTILSISKDECLKTIIAKYCKVLVKSFELKRLYGVISFLSATAEQFSEKRRCFCQAHEQFKELRDIDPTNCFRETRVLIAVEANVMVDQMIVMYANFPPRKDWLTRARSSGMPMVVEKANRFHASQTVERLQNLFKRKASPDQVLEALWEIDIYFCRLCDTEGEKEKTMRDFASMILEDERWKVIFSWLCEPEDFHLAAEVKRLSCWLEDSRLLEDYRLSDFIGKYHKILKISKEVEKQMKLFNEKVSEEEMDPNVSGLFEGIKVNFDLINDIDSCQSLRETRILESIKIKFYVEKLMLKFPDLLPRDTLTLAILEGSQRSAELACKFIDDETFEKLLLLFENNATSDEFLEAAKVFERFMDCFEFDWDRGIKTLIAEHFVEDIEFFGRIDIVESWLFLDMDDDKEVEGLWLFKLISGNATCSKLAKLFDLWKRILSISKDFLTDSQWISLRTRDMGTETDSVFYAREQSARRKIAQLEELDPNHTFRESRRVKAAEQTMNLDLMSMKWTPGGNLVCKEWLSVARASKVAGMSERANTIHNMHTVDKLRTLFERKANPEEILKGCDEIWCYLSQACDISEEKDITAVAFAKLVNEFGRNDILTEWLFHPKSESAGIAERANITRFMGGRLWTENAEVKELSDTYFKIRKLSCKMKVAVDRVSKQMAQTDLTTRGKMKKLMVVTELYEELERVDPKLMFGETRLLHIKLLALLKLMKKGFKDWEKGESVLKKIQKVRLVLVILWVGAVLIWGLVNFFKRVEVDVVVAND
ncbi:hypothetical protein HDU97_006610 [Phlyctochytrium planicorne]|nr:hypothetical protein HDU97_006610 [Phlyctochytrium planicorne]